MVFSVTHRSNDVSTKHTFEEDWNPLSKISYLKSCPTTYIQELTARTMTKITRKNKRHGRSEEKPWEEYIADRSLEMSLNIVDQRWIDCRRSWRRAHQRYRRRRDGWREGVVRELWRSSKNFVITCYNNKC